MAKINILDKSVYNRISAGEVVERPFSVVKELVENSLDAGAKNISVSIINGGINSITVSDDGCGIDSEELKKAFLPHATSKICDVSDLDGIETLGFRGEALASIGSVAKVKIVSKPKEQEQAFGISCDGGILTDTVEAACGNGTEITVDSLFFNTPVRAKFLKPWKNEENDISNIVSRLILANPSVAFKLIANGKTVFQSFGDGIESAMVSVYGKSAVDNCFYIDTEKNGIRINGYMGKHFFTKPNRTYQTLIINNRFVINATVSSAIQNVYGAYLMKRQYPFYVISLTIPKEAVDVNVHPNKLDVRFSNNQVVYGAVYSSLGKVLDGTSQALEIVRGAETEENEPKSETEIAEKSLAFKNAENYYNSPKIPEKSKDAYRQDEKFANPKVELNDSVREFVDIFSPEKKEKKEEAIDIFAENKRYLENLEKEELSKSKAKTENNGTDYLKNGFLDEEQFDYVGQALKTFLIFERGGDLYFIDQHAAHERLLYDKLMKIATESEIATQPMLLPYSFVLNGAETEYIKSRIDELKRLGVSIEEFGINSYRITELPIDLVSIDVKDFIDSILTDAPLKQMQIAEQTRERLIQLACKSAVKSGDKLSAPDIEKIKTELKNNLGLKCPHGRPVAIRITRTEIDKWFKRIV